MASNAEMFLFGDIIMYIRFWTYKDTPYLTLTGEFVGCISWGFWRKMLMIGRNSPVLVCDTIYLFDIYQGVIQTFQIQYSFVLGLISEKQNEGLLSIRHPCVSVYAHTKSDFYICFYSNVEILVNCVCCKWPSRSCVGNNFSAVANVKLLNPWTTG